MGTNIGGFDRLLRLVAALAMAGAIWAGWITGTLPVAIAALVAAVLALTAITRFCPAYRLIGLSTCPMERK